MDVFKLCVFFGVISLGTCFSLYKAGDNYEYWCTGNCDKNVNTNPHSGLILMGGGTDVDEAFAQQIKWSDCGDFLVLRSDRDDKYDKYIYDLGCANSAATIYVKNHDGANDNFVVSKINDAEAIFFAGGDQATYLSDWMGTQLQVAVQEAINSRNVPTGGTSAGCDIQGDYIYTASNGSVASYQALLDPYNSLMQFSNHFVLQKMDILNNTIVDTHFVTRDRFGRLMTFVARLLTDPPTNQLPIRGIGINEQTAFAIDLETGIAQIMGPQETSWAYVLLPNETPEICQPNRPLTFDNVSVQKLTAKNNDSFNFLTWTGGKASNKYTVSADQGVLSPIDPY